MYVIAFESLVFCKCCQADIFNDTVLFSIVTALNATVIFMMVRSVLNDFLNVLNIPLIIPSLFSCVESVIVVVL